MPSLLPLIAVSKATATSGRILVWEKDCRAVFLSVDSKRLFGLPACL
jgi:hypothetical protein